MLLARIVKYEIFKRSKVTSSHLRADAKHILSVCYSDADRGKIEGRVCWKCKKNTCSRWWRWCQNSSHLKDNIHPLTMMVKKKRTKGGTSIFALFILKEQCLADGKFQEIVHSVFRRIFTSSIFIHSIRTVDFCPDPKTLFQFLSNLRV